MGAKSVEEYVALFKKLDFNSKLEVLSRLPLELRKDSGHLEGTETESRAAEELFGIWKDEDELTEESIIHRTISDKTISLD